MFFLTIVLVLLFVLLKSIEDRKLLTKKYENAFFDFLTTGQDNECINDKTISNYNEARGLKDINRNISYLINDYINYVMDIYKEQNEIFYKGVDFKYNYKNFHNKENGMGLYNCGWVENSCFIKASLSELNYELTENKLFEVLENVIHHEGSDIHNGWILFGDENFKECLPGGIVIEYKKPKKIYTKKEVYYNSVKILSPIYQFNILTLKNEFNENIKVRVEYIENNESKTIEEKIWFTDLEYSLSPIYNKIYDYDSSTGISSSIISIYCEQDVMNREKRKKEYYELADKEEISDVIPDAVHYACIRNIDIVTFNSKFKKKLKESGLFENFNIKNTKEINVENNLSGKELRELTLDDGKDTKILCLFKIIYPYDDELFANDYEGGGPEEVGDILTYIIPDDKMNLSYEEMYQLAFND